MLCTVYIIVDQVNVLLKSRVRENRKHGSVGVTMAMKLLINLINNKEE